MDITAVELMDKRGEHSIVFRGNTPESREWLKARSEPPPREEFTTCRNRGGAIICEARKRGFSVEYR